ncbi:hypothetical protein [Deinococcus fonticola]|uniref:hypothetical protein n=1 Tax=Deinococcus fonticola TaxID=2528713 RepID=UPI001074DDB0|nr:hypothetical protein [Deinococcus fonticola]
MISDGLAMEMLEAQDAMLSGALEAVAQMADPRLVPESIHEELVENVIYTCVESRHGHDTALELVRAVIRAATFGMGDVDDEFYWELREQVAHFLSERFGIPRHDSN